MYYYEESVPEMLRMNPEMRVVVLLREPVSRAYSSHQYMRARGLEPVEDFLAAVELEEERKRLGWHHLWHYTSMSRYADSLAAIRAAFPSEQVGVWFYDELESDYVGTVSQHPAIPGCSGFRRRGDGRTASERVRSAPVRRVHRMIGWATGSEKSARS